MKNPVSYFIRYIFSSYNVQKKYILLAMLNRAEHIIIEENKHEDQVLFISCKKYSL